MKAGMLLLGVVLLTITAQAYSAHYNQNTQEVYVNGSYGRNEYLFLHEQGHAFWHEEMWWIEKLAWNFDEEYFASVYGESFTCVLKSDADERLKGMNLWEEQQ